MIEKKLKIEGMSCGHCVKAVHGLLSEIDGVESSEISLPDDAVVVFDETLTNVDNLKKIINDSGIYKTL